ncbi:hypothetical protein B0H66DRAFT_174672 [Apodospora peruviana]|uniref:Uncharacterized protein n=1 Tax=Apodospora peruviana TaxID=516989 RepID=A0AAE0IAP5_9PEZI|nr:hypothetical protein B0H66DRAFT_174672 [Apodospora peruviana]
MSSSIAISAPPPAAIECDRHHLRSSSKAAASSSSSSSYSSSPNTPERSATDQSRSVEKQKMLHSRRPSLLSTALSRQECTTINIADDPDGPLRLISYISSSQGFAWNPEMFLPSYVDYDYVPLEMRRDPVHEIVLSEEEVKKILPQ